MCVVGGIYRARALKVPGVCIYIYIYKRININVTYQSMSSLEHTAPCTSYHYENYFRDIIVDRGKRENYITIGRLRVQLLHTA